MLLAFSGNLAALSERQHDWAGRNHSASSCGIRLEYTGICNSSLSRRFGLPFNHRALGHEIALRDILAYREIKATLTNNARLLAEAADHCRALDSHVALRRAAIERASFAALVRARLELLGFRLTIAPGRLQWIRLLLSGLIYGLAGDDRSLIRRLARAEARMGDTLRLRLTDAALDPEIVGWVEAALQTVLPAGISRAS